MEVKWIPDCLPCLHCSSRNWWINHERSKERRGVRSCVLGTREEKKKWESYSNRSSNLKSLLLWWNSKDRREGNMLHAYRSDRGEKESEGGGGKETGVGLFVSQSGVVVRGRDHLQDALCVLLHQGSPVHLPSQQQVLPVQRVDVLHLHRTGRPHSVLSPLCHWSHGDWFTSILPISAKKIFSLDPFCFVSNIY